MNKKAIRGWMMYDWANSAFATTIMAAVLPVFFYDVAAVDLKESDATAYWGYANAAAVFLVALLSPILGAIADHSQSKLKFLRYFMGLGVISSGLLVWVGEGDYILALLLMIGGTIGFSGGNVFYDALLPSVAPKDKIDRISNMGYAFGYIGGGLLLAINLLMIMKYEWFGFPDKTTATQLCFLTVAIWWVLFSVPIFRHVKEYPSSRGEASHTSKGTTGATKEGLRRLRVTFREIRRYKQLFLFLLAFWLYNDGISTIIKMATIYGKDIGIGSEDLIAALLITQFVGIPCSMAYGKIAEKIGTRRALFSTLWIYVIIVGVGYFMTSALHFYILAVAVGLVQGGSQGLSRSIFSSMIPKGKEAEFFGFYGVSSKFSAVFGPLLFGLVGQWTGSSRLGILSLIVFFIAGIFLLWKVNIEEGRRQAQTITPSSAPPFSG
ncbi:MFS transporter [Marinicrinis lubricantis]|uniref:MFS transporter n=1 Tax=Marinicrinis lubricantis TaxID=2086470 RepID=A0ABW1IV91_9BACL